MPCAGKRHSNRQAGSVLNFASLVHALLGCASALRVTPSMIKPDLPMPQALQGHDDHVTMTMLTADNRPTPELLDRYAVIDSLSPGIRRYNLFWDTFERVPSQASPFACPSGAKLVPPTAADKDRLGFERYHCYSEAPLDALRVQMELDNLTGAQGAGILYSAPEFYRHPNCTGFPFGKGVVEKGGCVPLPEHVADYADYVRVMLGEFGSLLRHLVVWNEVASAGWMDMSPTIPNRAGPNGTNPLDDAQFNLWVSTYAGLLLATDQAVRSLNRTESTMIWSSNDRIWDAPLQREGQPLHVGGLAFNNRLWELMRNETMTWAMAVHPYDSGNPMDASDFDDGAPHRCFTFAALDRIDDYVVYQLKTVRGVDPDSEEGQLFRHQYASEQGWPFPACCDDRIRARNICYAHAVSSDSDSRLIGITHNHFQDTGGNQGGQSYGLIAANISHDLSNGTGYPTFDAYVSTSPAQWGQGDDHFCCARWRMGCLTKENHGVLDPVAPSANGSAVQVHGWAWSEAARKGGWAPVQVIVSVDTAKNVTIPLANESRADLVDAGAAPNPHHGFNVSVPVYNNRTIHRVDAWAVAPDGSVFSLESSPRCFKATSECPCVHV